MISAIKKTPAVFSLIILICFFPGLLAAQHVSDSTGQNRQDLQRESKEKKLTAKTDDTSHIRQHSAKLATWMSVALPGLGQGYNKKYWKIPVIYVGLGVCGYFVYSNHKKYIKYKESYLYKFGADSSKTDYFPNETLEYVKEYRDSYHRNVELSYIAAGLIYVLNIIDATVDAHLYNFDITDDLTLRVEPTVNSWGMGMSSAAGTGIKLTLKF